VFQQNRDTILVQKLEFWFDKYQATICRNQGTIFYNVHLCCTNWKIGARFDRIRNTI